MGSEPRFPSLRIATLAALALPLGGCVAAAAAIPVIAGSGMVGSRVMDEGETDVDAAGIPRPPFDRPAAVPTGEPPTDGTLAPQANAPLSGAAPGSLATPAAVEPATQASAASTPGALPPVTLTMPDGSKVDIDGGSATGTSTMLAQPVSANGAAEYARLLGYAARRAAEPASGAKRNSALLVAPAALKPDMQPCAMSQPALLIDLDPGDAPLDPDASYLDNPALASVLTQLRASDVSIHWLSSNSAAEAGAIRSLLAKTGLDEEGRDELVLMRYPDDRKQTRRRAIGATHCLVAIAGEERRDFDELYAFLKERDAAVALESLIGDGWFLIPAALQPALQPDTRTTDNRP